MSKEPRIGRNDPCPCGSGKKFKRCCLGLAHEEIEKRRLMNLEKTRKGKVEKRHSELVQECATQLASTGSFDLLLDLGSVALLPENQGNEARFLHIAEIICSQSISSSRGGARSASARALCEAFDARYSDPWESYEVDNQYVPYLSWVEFGGNVFRVFSGTLTQSELYIRDVFRKFLPLDPLVSKVLGFSVSDFFSFFLPKIDRVVQDAGLSEFESGAPEDYPVNTSFQSLELTAQIREALGSQLVFVQSDLSATELRIVEALSKDVGHYVPDMNRLFSEDADIMAYPIVRVGEKYVVPFPSLLLSVIPLRVARALADGEVRDQAAEAFESNTRGWLKSILEGTFGARAVLENPMVEGNRWCDFAVLFDGKVMQFVLVTSPFGEEVEGKIRTGLQNADSVWNALGQDPTPWIDSGKRRFRLPRTDLAEPMFFLVFDTLLNVFAAGIPRGVVREDDVFLLIDTGALDYLLHDTGSAIKFLKFLRAEQRIRRRVKEIHTTSPLDLYALFKGPETIQVREPSGNVDFLVVVPTSFPSLLLEQIREFRKEHGVFTVEGRRRILRKYYPGVFGEVDPNGNVFLLLPYKPREVTIEAVRGDVGREELGALYLAFDSLCYQLSIQKDWVAPLLDRLLPDLHTIKVRFDHGKQSGPVTSEVLREGDALVVDIKASTALGEVFQRRNNDGERLMLREFLTSLGLGKEAQELLDKALPASKERGFQQVLIPVQHVSFEREIEPIPIFRSDEAWVDEILADAVKASSIKQGVYEDKKAVMQLIVDVFNIANGALERRVQEFSGNELLGRCCEQLEVAYIDLERTKFQLAISAETDKFGGVAEEYARAEREATKLTFAIRHLLETAAKLQPASTKLLTSEAYTELLALSARVVDLDFVGDGIYLDIHPGRFEVSEAGYFTEKTQEGGSHHLERAKSELRTYQWRVEHMLAHEPEAGNNAFDRLADYFDRAFKDEFGYSLRDRQELHEVLLQSFHKSPNPLRLVDPGALNQELCKATGKDPSIVGRFLDDLELSQEQLAETEIHPSDNYWRDARIISRPLVRISTQHGERLLFSRTVLERAYMVFMDRLISGRLKRQEEIKSDAFRSAVGGWRSKLGDEFRDEISQQFSKHSWRVATEVKSVDGIGVPKEIGPIDVLAIDPSGHLIKVVECKDVAMSRNPKDVKNEIDNFFGRGKDPGYFIRLERKWKWVSDNITIVAREYGLDATTALKVEPLMVTSTFLVSRQYRDVPAPLMTAGELTHWLAGVDRY